jgi:hypothetical protein
MVEGPWVIDNPLAVDNQSTREPVRPRNALFFSTRPNSWPLQATYRSLPLFTGIYPKVEGKLLHFYFTGLKKHEFRDIMYS